MHAGGRLRPGIPTFKNVVGVELGEGPTGSAGRTSADIYAYFDAMMDARTATRGSR